MAQKIKPTCSECVTITKTRYQELLDYEQVALWTINTIIVASLPNIQIMSEKLKTLSNDAKYKTLQTVFQEALKEKETQNDQERNPQSRAGGKVIDNL